MRTDEGVLRNFLRVGVAVQLGEGDRKHPLMISRDNLRERRVIIGAATGNQSGVVLSLIT